MIRNARQKRPDFGWDATIEPPSLNGYHDSHKFHVLSLLVDLGSVACRLRLQAQLIRENGLP